MILCRFIFISFIFISHIYANKIELELKSKKIENADVALIIAKNSDKNNLKAILNDKEVNFVKHPFKKESYYVLMPFHYYMREKVHQLIVTYSLNDKNYFEGFDVNVVEGSYDSELIEVNNSKVSLNSHNKSRASLEYEEAMNIYNSVTPQSYWYDDFIYPMKSEITSAFGTKRVYNGKTKSYHTGIDFKADINSKVHF